MRDIALRRRSVHRKSRLGFVGAVDKERATSGRPFPIHCTDKIKTVFPAQTLVFSAVVCSEKKSIPLPSPQVLGIVKDLSQKVLDRGSGQRPARAS